MVGSPLPSIPRQGSKGEGPEQVGMEGTVYRPTKVGGLGILGTESHALCCAA